MTYWGKYVETLVAPMQDEIDEEADVEIEEDAEPMRMAADPGQPTQRQVEEHRRVHVPFRSWRKWCILGRGRGIQHRRSGGKMVDH